MVIFVGMAIIFDEWQITKCKRKQQTQSNRYI